jgi:hypothetical protein
MPLMSRLLRMLGHLCGHVRAYVILLYRKLEYLISCHRVRLLVFEASPIWKAESTSAVANSSRAGLNSRRKHPF